MPDDYTTNTTTLGGWVTQGIARSPDLASALEHVKEEVAYVSSQLYRREDLAGAIRCAMFLRHFFKSDVSGATHDPLLHGTINRVIKGTQDNLYTGVDSLNALIDQVLTEASDHPTQMQHG
jgi:hypothetical protein